jgi:choline dehydrogenase
VGLFKDLRGAATTIDPAHETRDSAKSSFLEDAMANTEIKVYLRTMVKKINFKNTNVASGVKVETLRIPYILTARKEVILLAGAL